VVKNSAVGRDHGAARFEPRHVAPGNRLRLKLGPLSVCDRIRARPAFRSCSWSLPRHSQSRPWPRRRSIPPARRHWRYPRAATRRAATILTQPNGKPWTSEHRPVYFQHKWRKATLDAELDGLHLHDIRGTNCIMLADAGYAPSNIAAMPGWTISTVNLVLDRYQAMTATQSDSAVTNWKQGADRLRNGGGMPFAHLSNRGRKTI